MPCALGPDQHAGFQSVTGGLIDNVARDCVVEDAPCIRQHMMRSAWLTSRLYGVHNRDDIAFGDGRKDLVLPRRKKVASYTALDFLRSPQAFDVLKVSLGNLAEGIGASRLGVPMYVSRFVTCAFDRDSA